MSVVSFIFAVGLGYAIAKRDTVKEYIYQVLPPDYIPPGFQQTSEEPQEPLMSDDEVL